MNKHEAILKASEDRVPTHCVWCQKEATKTEIVHTGDIWQRWCYCKQCDLESYHPIEEEDE